MRGEVILVNLYGKEYLLYSHRAIPQDVRNVLEDLTLRFQEMVSDQDNLDVIEKEAIKSTANISDAFMLVFLRKLTWLSGGWDFTLVPIGLRCYPTA